MPIATATAERIAKYETTARELLHAGFTTMAAQKDARDAASSAYAGMREVVMHLCLEVPDNTPEADEAREVYWGIPMYPHQWRAKHATLIRSNLPAGAEHIPAIERLAKLAADIKAAPINRKPPVRLNDAQQPVMRSDAFNPTLKAEFLKQAPALAAEYAAQVRQAFAFYAEKFGDGETVPCTLYPEGHDRSLTRSQREDRESHQRAVDGLICRHSDRVNGKVRTYRLNDEKVEREAKRYGELAALQWFYKTNRKLGELIAPVLHKDNGADVQVSGSKPDGAKVLMKQQRVVKWAPKACELYSQFPSRLYIDGQFTEERAYAKRYDTAAD